MKLLPGMGLLFFLVAPALAQDFVTTTRGDEVGSRDLEFGDSTFLDILTFQHPLETIQPWLAADSGYQVGIGSIDVDTFYLNHDLKLRSPVSERFSMRAWMRSTQDFDTSYTQVQAMPYLHLNKKVSLVAPFSVETDKGRIDWGGGILYEDEEREIDFLQLAWTRADLQFNDKGQGRDFNEVESAADTLEFQFQGNILGMGKTTLRAARQFPYRFRESLGNVERFRRDHAYLLQALEVGDRDRLFVEGTYEANRESERPTTFFSLLEFFGRRRSHSARVEYQFFPQEEDAVRLWRFGVGYFRYKEDEEFRNFRSLDATTQRRDHIFYGSYRMPVDWWEGFDVETALHVDFQKARVRAPNTVASNEDEDDFQAKASFYLRWQVDEGAEVVIAPTFQLDKASFGGGAFMFRWFF